MDSKQNRRKSLIWKSFKDIGNFIAVCNFCQRKISYKSTTNNLRTHLNRLHPIVVLPLVDSSKPHEDDDPETEEAISLAIGNESIENCTIVQDSMHDYTVQIVETSTHKQSSAGDQSMSENRQKFKRWSRIWKHFKNLGEGKAVCKSCHKQFCFKSTISNLYAHLRRKHPKLNLKEQEEDMGDQTMENGDDASNSLPHAIDKSSCSVSELPSTGSERPREDSFCEKTLTMMKKIIASTEDKLDENRSFVEHVYQVLRTLSPQEAIVARRQMYDVLASVESTHFSNASHPQFAEAVYIAVSDPIQEQVELSTEQPL